MKLFFFLSGIFFAWTACGETLSIDYEAQGAGMRLMHGTIVIEETPETYRVTSTGRMSGLLGWLVGGEAVFETLGRFKKDMFYPDSFRLKSRSRTRIVTFKVTTPTIDYQTALMRMLALQKPKTQSFLVDDGRRQMDLSFLYRGKETILVQQRDVLCDVYDVTLRRVSGKKGGWFFNRMGNKDDSPLHFYMGIDPETGRYMLLKADFETTLFGTITISRSDKEKK